MTTQEYLIKQARNFLNETDTRGQVILAQLNARREALGRAIEAMGSEEDKEKARQEKAKAAAAAVLQDEHARIAAKQDKFRRRAHAIGRPVLG